MIGAVEKQKLVYILNRNSAAELTISSPLEAHKSHTIVHHIVGVDVGYENPIFACIEVDYSDVDQDATGEAMQNLEKVCSLSLSFLNSNISTFFHHLKNACFDVLHRC